MTTQTRAVAELLWQEIARAERDGFTIEQAPTIQGDGTALEGYLAGLKRAEQITEAL